MSCAMICGEPNIWPKPTGKTKLNARSATLNTDIISYRMDTRFTEVEQLFRSAFHIFITDLRNLEAQHIATDGISSTNHNTEEKSIGKERLVADDQVNPVRKTGNVQKLDINVLISGTLPEVYPHLDIDESYNLTLTSKYFPSAHLLHILV